VDISGDEEKIFASHAAIFHGGSNPSADDLFLSL